MGKIIGIDLGTTNSVVAVLEGGNPVVIPNQEGGRTTPSVVAFNDKGERLVGQIAKRQAITNPKRTVFSVKRFMGRRYDEVGTEMTEVPFEVVKGANDSARIKIDGKDYSPPEISAFILQKLKQTAEEYLGEKVTEAIITVPAYFNDSQRTGHQGSRPRSPGSTVRANHQRADGRRPGLRAGEQEEGREGRRLRLRRRNVMTSRSSTLGDNVFEVMATNGDTSSSAATTSTRSSSDWHRRRVQEDRRHRPSRKRPDGPPAAASEAAEKAKVRAVQYAMESNINLPFITADARRAPST